jgi:hypothetical protein
MELTAVKRFHQGVSGGEKRLAVPLLLYAIVPALSGGGEGVALSRRFVHPIPVDSAR